MILGSNVRSVKSRMEQADKLIAIYNSDISSANSDLAQDGILSSGTGGETNAAEFNRFTMFIDVWGTSVRKVGR